METLCSILGNSGPFCYPPAQLKMRNFGRELPSSAENGRFQAFDNINAGPG
jgi:hypothetical protein